MRASTTAERKIQHHLAIVEPAELMFRKEALRSSQQYSLEIKA